MSMRIKIAFVIILIVSVFITLNYISNRLFIKKNITEAMEQDLSFARDIGDGLISMKITLLRSDAETVAERLLKAGRAEKMLKEMAAQMRLYPDFISLTIYDRKGIVANYGEPVDHDVFLSEFHYIKVAFDGRSIISTTHYNNLSGSLIMHVFVPMGKDMVLSATIPGMIFSDLLSKYKLWNTGNIFLTDENGKAIAYYREEFVLDLVNVITVGQSNPEYKDIGNFFSKMITDESGTGTYMFEGVERICSYKRVAGSNAGWRIAVSVPLSESPMEKTHEGLMLSFILFIVMGAIASFFVSGIVARPFYKVKAQNLELAELSEKVMTASKAKTKFLANMSHEMRTPLNAIIGLSKMTLETGSLDEKTLINLKKINNSGITLLSTINDILDISKIETGKLEFVSLDYETASLINDAVTQSIMLKGEKPIQFILDIDEKLPSHLNGDELRVKHIINNLLSNAFKYTKEGTVTLSINCEREDDDTVWMTISVKDTGIGIRSEHLNNLFTDYNRMDTFANRNIEGTGLGLSIAKKMLEMMDGSISVESEYEKGSVFTAKLKQKFVSDTTIGTEVMHNLKKFRYSDNRFYELSQLERIDLSYARVLVVDDVEMNLDVAEGLLEPYGMQIDCVTSAREAINAIRDEKVKYNAIFMDHMMPEMNGIEAVRIIREKIGTEYAKTIPIIALTANALVGNEEMFLSKGFQAFLPKPIETSRLDAILRQWV